MTADAAAWPVPHVGGGSATCETVFRSGASDSRCPATRVKRGSVRVCILADSAPLRWADSLPLRFCHLRATALYLPLDLRIVALIAPGGIM